MLIDLTFYFSIMPHFILHAVHLLNEVKCPSPVHSIYALRIRQIRNRITGRHKLHALVVRRQKTTAPGSIADRLISATLRKHNDEGWQVFIHTAESVTEPGTNTGPSTELVAGLGKNDCRLMVDLFRKHRFDDTQVVCNGSNMGNMFRKIGAVTAMLGECGGRHGKGKRILVTNHTGNTVLSNHGRRYFLSVHAVQFWLVIEQLHLRRTSTLKEVDDPFCPWLKMRINQGFVDFFRCCNGLLCSWLFAPASHQCLKGYASKTQNRSFQEFTSLIFKMAMEKFFHDRYFLVINASVFINARATLDKAVNLSSSNPSILLEPLASSALRLSERLR